MTTKINYELNKDGNIRVLINNPKAKTTLDITGTFTEAEKAILENLHKRAMSAAKIQ